MENTNLSKQDIEILSPAQIEAALMSIIATNEDISSADLKAKFNELYPGQKDRVISTIINQLL